MERLDRGSGAAETRGEGNAGERTFGRTMGNERRGGGLDALRSLIQQWTADALVLRRYGDERGACIRQMHAEQLEDALQELQWQAVSLDVAEGESGYTRGHLRRMLNEGTLPNAGTAEDPRILRCNLPRKPGHGIAAARRHGAYSRVQVARAIAEGG